MKFTSKLPSARNLTDMTYVKPTRRSHCIILLIAIGFALHPGAASAETIAGWTSRAFSLTSAPKPESAAGIAAPSFLASRSCPFSFSYGGKSSRDLLPGWKREAEGVTTTLAGTKQTLRWTDPDTGLRLTAEVTSFKDSPAVEWILRFENAGARDTPILADVQALDLALGTTPRDHALELHQIAGSSATRNDFVPSKKTILPGSGERFASRGGRSSDGAFPFFTLCFGDENLIAAIGWTGQWSASIDRDSTGPARVRAGMELTHLTLHPGESIRTPRILLLSHRGDRIEAQNLFRRLILAHYAPRIDGQLPRAAIGAQSFNLLYLHRISGYWATEAGQIQAAHVNQKMGADTLWMDAGWFPGFFPNGAGNWLPRPDDFPQGLKPVGDACHRLGLRFLLWYEPERVAVDTVIANEHPEFVLGGKKGGLFNLGDAKARRWMTDLLDRQIEEFGLDCYRQDFNMDPLPFWRANDAPDRQGITEIRHIEGLYAMWDELRSKHPQLYIDNCASGGRRIDLETISRAIVQTRSDTEGVPGRADWEQSQTWGLNLYYPLSSAFTWDLSSYDFRSYAAAGLLGEWDVLSPQFPIETVRTALAEARENQPYFTGDYFPLTPWTMAPDQWMAYQFHRADLDAGIVLAFRHAQSPWARFWAKVPAFRHAQNPRATFRAKLRGLDPRGSYQVTFIGDDYKPVSRIMSGETLADLELRLEKPRSSLLVRYQAQH
jgi:alpha-galactosidase